MARWSTDVSMDVYFFLLAGALSATGVGPVEERAKQAFRFLSTWRTDVIPEYLAAYGQPDRYLLLPQKIWDDGGVCESSPVGAGFCYSHSMTCYGALSSQNYCSGQPKTKDKIEQQSKTRTSI